MGDLEPNKDRLWHALTVFEINSTYDTGFCNRERVLSCKLECGEVENGEVAKKYDQNGQGHLVAARYLIYTHCVLPG